MPNNHISARECGDHGSCSLIHHLNPSPRLRLRPQKRRPLVVTYTIAYDGIVAVDRALHIEEGRRYVLGRASDADLPLPDTDRRISRYHAAVEATLGGVRIKDLGSANGMFVNGTQVDTAILRPGDRLRLGKTVLVVGTMDSALPKVFGVFRPSRAGSAIPTETTSVLVDAGGTARTAWLEAGILTCAACGASWPHAEQEAGGGCSVCQPRRPRSDSDPQTIGPFEILSVLGSGEGSIVYEARHQITGMKTALKRPTSLTPGDSARAAWLQRAREDETRLHHPRIVRTYEAVWDKETGEMGVSMEWHRAGNCRKLGGPRSNLRAMLLLGADLFDAIAYLHALGLTHGAIKPENLLLTLTDDDLWRGRLADHGCHSASRDKGFTAPELVGSDQQATRAADIYSAAATISFLLTGAVPNPPEQGTSQGEAGRRACLSELRPDAPRELCDLLDSALLADPAARTSVFAGEIAIHLRRIAHSL